MDTIKLKLIYPKWNKLPGQTTFNLPPHGPVAFAATLPEWVFRSLMRMSKPSILMNHATSLRCR